MPEPNRLRNQVAPNTTGQRVGAPPPTPSTQRTPNAGPPTSAPTARPIPRGVLGSRSRSRPTTVLVWALGQVLVLGAIGAAEPSTDSSRFVPFLLAGEVALGHALGPISSLFRGYRLTFASLLLGTAIACLYVPWSYLQLMPVVTLPVYATAVFAWIATTVVLGILFCPVALLALASGRFWFRRRRNAATNANAALVMGATGRG